MLFKNRTFFSQNFALDLGTSNLVLHKRNFGIVLEEQSVVLKKKGGRDGGQIIAIGNAAHPMLGRVTKNLEAVRPLRDGVVSDFEGTEALIKYALKKAGRGIFGRSRLVVGIPASATPVDRRAIQEIASISGFSLVHLVEEGVAAAIGAGLDLFDPVGCMVVDIGGGTTEVTIVSMGSVAHSASVRYAGDKIDEAIVSLVRREFNVAIGEQTAEKIKMELGAIVVDNPFDDGPFIEIIGRDCVTGKPTAIIIGRRAISETINEIISVILTAIQTALESVSPEYMADLLQKGIFITGGGALIRNIDKIISSSMEIPVFIAEDPLRCVARGLGLISEDMVKYRNFLLSI